MPYNCRGNAKENAKKTLRYSLISPSILSLSPAHSPALIFLYCDQFYPLKSIKMLFRHIWILPKIRIGHSKLGRRSKGVTKGLSQFGLKV
jgi:hypothetical protein